MTRSLLALLAILCVSISASGQIPFTNYDEPGLNSGRSFVSHSDFEAIDPFTGNLELHYIDQVIPGNGGFDLRVQRSYNMLKLGEALSPFGRGWDIHFGRVKSASGAATCAAAPAQDLTLELPDGSSQTLHRAIANSSWGTTTNSHFITNKFWKAQCTTAGLDVWAPDGTKYEMSDKDGAYWHAKFITNRLGKQFTINYLVISGWRKVVDKIFATDGSDDRYLDFVYNANRLSAITGHGPAGNQTWNYTVQSVSGYNILTQVDPPMAPHGRWSYDYYTGTNAWAFALWHVTMPYGAQTTYTYNTVDFLRNLPGSKDSAVVVGKTIGTDTWQYTYQPACGSGTLDQTTVTLPSSINSERTITYKHYSICSVSSGDVWKVGLLAEKYLGNTQSEAYTWIPMMLSDEDYARTGYPVAKTDSQVNRALLSRKVVVRDGTTYDSNYGGIGNFDTFGNPTALTEAGTRSRSHTFSYFNSGTGWMVGFLAGDVVTDFGRPAITVLDRDYNTSNGNINSESRFGVTTSLTYFAHGGVQTRTDARNFPTTYNNYLYGVPQLESRPQGVTISRVVGHPAGLVTSQSDGLNAWGYGYDGNGRPGGITTPSAADSNIVVNYPTITTRTRTRGVSGETTTFDLLGRPKSVSRDGIVRNFTYDIFRKEDQRKPPQLADHHLIHV